MISDTIQKQVIEAMKAKDTVRVSTLRMLSSELKNAKIEKGSDLTEEDELKVIKKEAKKRRDAIEAYEKAGNSGLADKEKAELKILEEYLPEQLSDEEVKKMVLEAISQTGASSPSEMGKVMGVVMGKVAGRADGQRVSAMVKDILLKG